VLLSALLTTGSSFLLDNNNNNDEYQVWVTTGDGSRKMHREAPCVRSSQHTGFSVWVDRNKWRQEMVGFGAALSNSAAYVIYHSPDRHAIMRDLFGNGTDDLGKLSTFTHSFAHLFVLPCVLLFVRVFVLSSVSSLTYPKINSLTMFFIKYNLLT